MLPPTRPSKRLNGSLVVAAVVAPAQAHTVLLLLRRLVEQMRHLVGQHHGNGWGGARATGSVGDHGGAFHPIVELGQREFDLGELALHRLRRLIHARRHHGVLVLLTSHLETMEDEVQGDEMWSLVG